MCQTQTSLIILKKMYFSVFFRTVPSVEKPGQTVKEFQAGRDLIEDEFSEENRVKKDVYVYYAKSIGMLLAILSVIFYALFQTFTVGANLWLSVWSEDEEAGSNAAKRNMYLGVYGALGLLQVR